MAEIVNSTFPDPSAIPAETLQGVRARLAAATRLRFPDLDTRPGSVHGDLSLSPDAFRAATVEAGINGLLGDLNMDNIIEGVVHDCDFVAQYLRQLGVTERPNAASTGVVRLFFDRTATDAAFLALDGDPFVVDRGLQFRFGESNIFRMRLTSAAGGLTLTRPGDATAGVGTRTLAVLDAYTYALDLPITGVLTDAVAAGAQAELDQAVPGLTAAITLTDISAGNPPMTLAQRAQASLALFHASSLSTRGGAVGFVLRSLPSVSACSPVLSGDAEMARDKTNVLGLADGRMDLYVRSTGGLMEDTLVVDLPYVVDGNKARFLGPVSFPSAPSYITGLVAEGAPSLSLWAPEAAPAPSPVLISYSKDSTQGILGGVARSLYEGFVLAVDQQFNGLDPLIPVQVGPNGQYGRFTITYRLDPAVSAAHELVSDPSNAPVGVKVMARAFVPLVFSSLAVRYLRQHGATLNAGLARSEILTSIASLSYPGTFTLSDINDALLYAGASGVLGIAARAVVRQSAATYYLKAGRAVPSTNAELDALLADGLVAVPVDELSDSLYDALGSGSVVGLSTGYSVIGNPETLRPKAADPSRYMAYGPRNITYVLDSANLTLLEGSL